MLAIDDHITLRDGRRLAYTVHGAKGGRPIFFLHGNPGSRHMRHPDERIAAELDVRIITPDRPGFGESDYQMGRGLLDMPDDLGQLADALSIDRFALFGVSAGGPYVAACGHAMPGRLQSAAIVSGAAPFDRPGAYEGVNPAYQMVFRMAAQLPFEMLAPVIEMHVLAAMHRPHKAWVQRMHMASVADREILADEDIHDQVEGYYPEAVRHGARGITQEAKILGDAWGFSLAAVPMPIDLWYWADDTIVPPQMGRYLAAHLPQAQPFFLPGGGHFAIFKFWRQILQRLAGC